MSVQYNPDDPSAPVQLSAEAKQIEQTVMERMNRWIDDRVSSLQVEFSKRAETAGNSVVEQMQDRFDDIVKETSESMAALSEQIKKIKGLDPTRPEFHAEIDKLAAAVSENQKAMEARKEEFRKYGRVAGAVGKKMLMAGI